MKEKEHDGLRPRRPARKKAEGLRRLVQAAVHAAICNGYLVGRSVSIGNVPGVIVGYNIGRFGRFSGNAYPLLVRTALGVTKCTTDELKLV